MRSSKDLVQALSKARTHGERVALLGALLAKDSGLGDTLVIVGGSALSVYTHGAYVSKDIDIVGVAKRLAPTLRRWGFHRKVRQGRGYWVRDDLGLLIDVIDRQDYVGLNDATRVEETRFGPVRIAAVEDLIIRRLVFAKRTRRRELLDQATLLWIRFGSELDVEYLDYHARFEDVQDLFRLMKRRATQGRPLDRAKSELAVDNPER